MATTTPTSIEGSSTNQNGTITTGGPSFVSCDGGGQLSKGCQDSSMGSSSVIAKLQADNENLMLRMQNLELRLQLATTQATMKEKEKDHDYETKMAQLKDKFSTVYNKSTERIKELTASLQQLKTMGDKNLALEQTIADDNNWKGRTTEQLDGLLSEVTRLQLECTKLTDENASLKRQLEGLVPLDRGVLPNRYCSKCGHLIYI